MKEQKIAVITSAPTVKNYGAYLQAYATQRLLEGKGYSVKLISYTRKTLDEAKTLKDIALGIAGRRYFSNTPLWFRYIAALVIYPSVRKLEKSFSSFSNRMFRVTECTYFNENSLEENPPQADVYCTGGDQMWNEQHNFHKTMREYYLTWVPDNRVRISLFTSIGKSTFDEWEREEVAEMLSKYQLISVREDSGKKAIEELGIKNVYHLQDPTILLDVEEWYRISEEKIVEEKYILLYEISRKSPLVEFAKVLAKSTGMKVVRINYYYFDNYKYGKAVTAPTLEKFLSLFQYADYVTTNSFHGTAFSIIFGRKICGPGANPDRLRSVLEFYGLEDRICVQPATISKIISQPIDENVVKERIIFAKKDFEIYMDKVWEILVSKDGGKVDNRYKEEHL